MARAHCKRPSSPSMVDSITNSSILIYSAWTVIGKKHFNSNGQTAKLGIYGFAFTWAAFGCFLISAVLFCVGGGVGKSDSSRGKSSYFGRKRSTRSRGSFRDSESGRRVKDEYD